MPVTFCVACSIRRSKRPIRAMFSRPICRPNRPAGGVIVVGGGKSAAVMAAALEDAWPDVALEGTVVTRYGHAVPTRRIEVIEASHPVPDVNSERGARRLLERVQGLSPQDLVIALMSGGASAPFGGAGARPDIERQTAINRALLASGANIGEMNTVRKHLSAIKGGRLAAAAAPAREYHPGDQRCPGRRSRRDRLGPDRPRSDDVRRGAGTDRAVSGSRRPPRSPRGCVRMRMKHQSPAACQMPNFA